MFKHSAIPMGLIGLLAVLVLMGAVTDFRALDRGHLGLVYPLDTDACGTALTSATLSCRIMAIRANRQTLMIPPGTWTINANLTVPSNIGLWVAEGAMFNISAGVTLTINGSLRAPMAPIVSGAGNVVFGPHVSELSPSWFGAAFDGAADDTAALTRTLAAASASRWRTVRLPAGIGRITSEVTIPHNVGLRGENWNTSVIRVVGATRGFLYAGAVTEVQQAHFEDFSVVGDPATALDLFTVQGASWNVRFHRVRLRGTAQNALVLHEVPGLAFINGEIAEFRQAGITNTAWANRVTVQGTRFEDYSTAHLKAAIDLYGVNNWNIIGNSFESATSLSLTALRVDACSNIAFEWNYAERYNHHLIVGHTTASNAIVIRNNYLHTFNPFKLDFATDSLVHTNLEVTHNGFGGVSGISQIFLPGASATYKFAHNTRDGVTPAAWVAGFPADRQHVEQVLQPVMVNGVAIGLWTRGLSAPGGVLTLESSDLGGIVKLNAGAGGGVVLIQAGGNTAAQYDAIAESGNLTRTFLWDVDRGALFRIKVGANGSGPGGIGRALVIDDAP
jgi:hypothetical protein